MRWVSASFIKAYTSKKQRVKGNTDWKPIIKQTRALKEYFATLDSVPAHSLIRWHSGLPPMSAGVSIWMNTKRSRCHLLT